MAQASEEGEVVQAVRVILATPRSLFRAFLVPETMASWRTFDGTKLAFSALNARIGGDYRARPRIDAGTIGPGLARSSTSPSSSWSSLARSGSSRPLGSSRTDPALAGSITLTTSFEPDPDGTKVTFLARGAPGFVDADKQAEILADSLPSSP